MKRLPAILILMALLPGEGVCVKFYGDDPLVREPAPLPVEDARSRKLSDYYDILTHTLATPGERQPAGGEIGAMGVNTLGEPMEGAWWERRHYYRRMTADELRRGPGGGSPPAMDGPWTVVSAKTEGITPGFVILDRLGRRYFIKFDPPSNPEMATGADQIASKIFHALGYHVPDNYVVYFRPDILELGEEVRIEDRLGRKHPMTPRDLSEILMRVHRCADGRYRATASLALPGKTLGPYRYYGTRSDDPNDTVPHEHRRDLRAMHLACALVNHDDSRSINTVDVLVDGPRGKYIRHYQLDFGSTLGSGSDKVNSPRSGGEYLFGWRSAATQLLTLGLAVPPWARARYPPLEAVGRFESALFDPDRWVPEYPNPAFLNRLPDDEFWMAKQIVRLRDDDIAAIVETARYSDPRAAEWIARCLMERRDKIGVAAFARVLPLDRFGVSGGRLRWEDVAASAGLGPPLEVSVRWERFDNAAERGTPLPGAAGPDVPPVPGDGYLRAVLGAAGRPGQEVSVYLRKEGERLDVVGVERTW
ncbi:MAG: hypothetical protein GXY47_05550 [Acidobacteria bacterium]|nr:hypothetical protein [Acidobacteriota bacterium]